MKLRIVLQSLSFCLIGYAWFGQASLRRLLKWSVGGLARPPLLRAVVGMCPMPELPASQSRLVVFAIPRGCCLHRFLLLLMPT
jgi:hypothetical protein